MKCPEIEHNFSLHYLNNQVKVGPCCIARHSTVDPAFPILEQPYLQNLKSLNHQNQLTDSCRACIDAERSGGSSRRTSQLNFYRDWKGSGIRGIDVHLGNLCNLSCVIFGPHDSTSWHQDAEKLGIPILPEFHYRKHSQYDFSWLADLEDLEMVHFWGGEPLMSNRHLDFMNELDRKGVLSRCRIIYNTNGTQTVNQEVLDAWSRSRLVELYFSIDDIEARFDYQRHGARWQDVVANLDWYQTMPINNFMFYINTVWSMLNVYYLPDLLDWKNRFFSQTRFGDRIELIFSEADGRCRVGHLPDDAKQKLHKKLGSIPELTFVTNSLEARTTDIGIFQKFITELDAIRNIRYVDSHPEWAGMIFP